MRCAACETPAVAVADTRQDSISRQRNATTSDGEFVVVSSSGNEVSNDAVALREMAEKLLVVCDRLMTLAPMPATTQHCHVATADQVSC